MPGQVYTGAPNQNINGAIGCMLSHKLCLEAELFTKEMFNKDV